MLTKKNFQFRNNITKQASFYYFFHNFSCYYKNTIKSFINNRLN